MFCCPRWPKGASWRTSFFFLFFFLRVCLEVWILTMCFSVFVCRVSTEASQFRGKKSVLHKGETVREKQNAPTRRQKWSAVLYLFNVALWGLHVDVSIYGFNTHLGSEEPRCECHQKVLTRCFSWTDEASLSEGTGGITAFMTRVMRPDWRCFSTECNRNF